MGGAYLYGWSMFLWGEHVFIGGASLLVKCVFVGGVRFYGWSMFLWVEHIFKWVEHIFKWVEHVVMGGACFYRVLPSSESFMWQMNIKRDSKFGTKKK